MAGVLDDELQANLGELPDPPHMEYVRMPAPFLGREFYEVPCNLLTAARTFRTNKRRKGTPHLVRRHQVEYPA